LVTTGRDPLPEQQETARRLARELGARLVERGQLSLRRLAQSDASGGAGARRWVLVVERHRLTLHAGGQELFFHPGMAASRIGRLLDGRPDPMVQAMELAAGDRVLDATLGLASDALVASFAVGARGQVVGVERVAVLAVLVREGLKSYPWPRPELAEAAARIQVVPSDHRSYLAELPPASFDVVYFDAMFHQPLSGSAAMAAWRAVASHEPVHPEALALARRVARRAVVLKDRRDSPRLDQLRPPVVRASRSSRVVYGVWPAGG